LVEGDPELEAKMFKFREKYPMLTFDPENPDE